MRTLPPLLLLAAACLPAHAGDIDLRCGTLAQRMIERLSGEGLLDLSGDNRQRARAIALELCAKAETSARRQHEEGKRQALSNWFFESSGGKPGNKRLRK